MGLFSNRVFHPAPMTHDRVFNANPVLRGDKAGLSNSETLSAILTGGYTFNKSFEAAKARQRAAEMAKDSAARQQAIDDQLATVDANYGVGDGAGAAESRGTIGGILDKTTNDYHAGQNEQLQGMFSQALSNNRFDLADRGLTGSGVDEDRTKGAVGTYLNGRQQVAQNAGMYRSSLESGLNQQRNTLRDQVMKGTTLDPNTLQEIGDAQFAVGQARNNIPAQTIGNIFSNGGAAMGQNQVANANQSNGFGGGLWPSAGSQPYGGSQVSTSPSSSSRRSGSITG